MTPATNTGPLAGLRVIEIAAMGPVPFCGMLLGDLGADVIRIDRPETDADGRPPDLRGRNKRSIALDLKSEAGQAAFFELIATADILLEGFRPGTAERLGIGPEDCMAVRPVLVYGRATGWGQEGPLAMTAGHDINYVALTGALHMIGNAGGPPVPPLNLVGDYAGGGLFLALGAVSAVLEARASGKGQIIDAAMIDGVNALLTVFYGFKAEGRLDDRRGANDLDGGAPYYTTYATADGRHLAVGAIEDRFYGELVSRLGLRIEDIPDRNDRHHWPQIRVSFEKRFAEKPLAEWVDIFEGSDACVTPVLTLGEAGEHAHNRHRQNVVTAEGAAHPRPAPRFSRSEPAIRMPPPRVAGEHTMDILTEIGWDEARIAALLTTGAAAARS